jgi:DEAD/DEAH box helicase domain-containing protein
MAAHNILVFDLETQKSFQEVGGFGKNHLLKISVIGIYSYLQDKYFCFEEHEVYKAGEMFAEADQVVGFNIRHFDYEVLKPYVSFDPQTLPTVDIMQDIEKIIGHRVKLQNVAETTLGVGKSGDGLEALRMFRQGRIEELKKYCLQDVKVTKEIYDYAQKYSKLMYKDYFDVREIKIKFPEPAPKKPAVRQASLF